MSDHQKPFIPAWLNNAGLSQAEFRVYCYLASRADNKTGIAWPQADTIASDCCMARNTVWKTIKLLEDPHKLIRRLSKPFGKSNRYLILTPNSSITDTIEEPPIGANQIPIEGASIGAG